MRVFGWSAGASSASVSLETAFKKGTIMPKFTKGLGTWVRVLLVDTDAMSSELLASALKRGRGRLEISTLVGDPHEVIRTLGSRKPHVVVINAGLGESVHAAFQVLEKLKESQPYAAGIVLFQSRKPDYVLGAFRRGARGVFYRNQPYKALAKCIRVVHGGQIWANNEDLEFLLRHCIDSKSFKLRQIGEATPLTRRQEDVFRLVPQGMRNEEIGRTLKVTEHSVRNYLSQVFRKFNVSSRVELVLCAFSEGRRTDLRGGIAGQLPPGSPLAGQNYSVRASGENGR